MPFLEGFYNENHTFEGKLYNNYIIFLNFI